MRCVGGRRENSGGRTDHPATVGHIGDHGGIGADDHIVTDSNTSNHHRPGADIDPITDDRIAVRAARTTRANGHTLTDGAMGTQLAVKMYAAKVTDIEARTDFTVRRDADAEQYLDEELENAIDQPDWQRQPARTNGPAPAPQAVHGYGQKTELGGGRKSCAPGAMDTLPGDQISPEVRLQWRLPLRRRLRWCRQWCLGFPVHEWMPRKRFSFRPPDCQPATAHVCSLTNTGAA